MTTIPATCQDCGGPYLRNTRGTRQTRCSACQAIHRRAINPTGTHHKCKQKYDAAFTVILDPDPSGAFRPGAEISKIELNCMVTHGTFTPGTTLRDRAGAVWRVCQQVRGGMRVYKIGEDAR